MPPGRERRRLRLTDPSPAVSAAQVRLKGEIDAEQKRGRVTEARGDATLARLSSFVENAHTFTFAAGTPLHWEGRQRGTRQHKQKRSAAGKAAFGERWRAATFQLPLQAATQRCSLLCTEPTPSHRNSHTASSHRARAGSAHSHRIQSYSLTSNHIQSLLQVLLQQKLDLERKKGRETETELKARGYD